MFKEIPENVLEDPWEYSKRFRLIFKKIPGNVSRNLNLGIICENLSRFYNVLQLKCYKTTEKTIIKYFI